jgi:Na+-transporting methylmalonyl-CoA/oxaloacetate decarboxylase gamma subunit
MEASMIHTLFWLTGIVTWFLIALVCAMWLVAEILERSVIRRARNG